MYPKATSSSSIDDYKPLTFYNQRIFLKAVFFHGFDKYFFKNEYKTTAIDNMSIEKMAV